MRHMITCYIFFLIFLVATFVTLFGGFQVKKVSNRHHCNGRMGEQ